jgi:hypothetical protein
MTRRGILIFLWSLLIFATLALIIMTSPVLRGSLGESIFLLFTVFTSPFIMESSLMIIGFLVVVTLSKARQEAEKVDEWVELEVPDDRA